MPSSLKLHMIVAATDDVGLCFVGHKQSKPAEPANFPSEHAHKVGPNQCFSVVGRDHKLANSRLVTTFHVFAGRSGTTVVESYIVDMPAGNTKEETCVFADTIRSNLAERREHVF